MKEEKEFYSIGRGSLNLNGKFYYGLDYAITDFMRSLEEENKHLKDNWNNLKEYLNEGTFYYKTGNGEYTTEMVSNRINGLDTLRKMQELEQGSDSK